MTSIARPVDPDGLPVRTGSDYPGPFRSQVLPREKRALGDAAGLTRIGVNHTVLAPGTASSMRHRHTHEDELIYLLAGERTIRAGQFAGFPAGRADGHQFLNRGTMPAVYKDGRPY